jgi:hypothetical protein
MQRLAAATPPKPAAGARVAPLVEVARSWLMTGVRPLFARVHRRRAASPSSMTSDR